eukprot:CAMPEP_0184689086 /NCGR_PEP_ID=MMETSP0312-20130426/30460_1 /TAXON_ID=31354 /ORGANISM="Compsopogon coeruleus, Strain SAG 36.94" /LENGTH=361 /DNA_ID=CAMNT_0027146393 /DNA_START=1 /DNA_END=1086 /DNA_ORIENTATION=-
MAFPLCKHGWCEKIKTRMMILLVLFVFTRGHHVLFSRHDQCFASLERPAILLLGCDRPSATTRAVQSLASLEAFGHFELYVSVDQCEKHRDVFKVLAPYVARNVVASVWLHERPPIQGLAVRQKIAIHYEFALRSVFDHRHNHTHVIVVEDDMIFAPDFLRLFLETGWLLDADPTVFCISSWNDNGFPRFAQDPNVLRRTDYFPGLGWMIRREAWQSELREKWPGRSRPNHVGIGWDYWIRMPSQMQGRDCVFPEFSRNRNLGDDGANVGAKQFNEQLRRIALSSSKEAIFRPGLLLSPLYQQRIARDLHKSDWVDVSMVRKLNSFTARTSHSEFGRPSEGCPSLELSKPSLAAFRGFLQT